MTPSPHRTAAEPLNDSFSEQDSAVASWLRYDFRLHALLIALIASSYIIRTPSVLMHPPLFNEDAFVLFNHYYNRDAFGPWLVEYAGYVSVGPDLLAFVASMFPTSWMPHVYLWMALGVSASTLSLFYLPRFRALLGSDAARFLTCLVLALLPLGNGALFRSLTWCFWPLLLASTLLCLVPGPRRPGIGEFSLLLVNSWSSPLSTLLIPLYLWRLRGSRSVVERLQFISLVVAALAYLACIAADSLSTSIVTTVQLPAAEHSRDIAYAVRHTLPAIADRVIFEPLFTNRVRVGANARGFHLAVVTIGALVVLVTTGLVLRDRELRARAAERSSFLIGVVYLTLGITALSLYARFGIGGTDYLRAFHHRYFWVQQYLVVLAGISILYPVFARLGRTPKRVAAAMLLPIILIYGSLDAFEFAPGTNDGVSVKVFLEKVSACESAASESAQDCSLPMVLEQEDPRFPIIIKRFR